MEHTEQMKTIRNNMFCEGMKAFILSIACADMFFVDFNLECFADNIMWFAVMIFLIVSSILSLANDYRYLKERKSDE